MCLDAVTYTNSRPLKGDERWAWKAFYVNEDGTLESPYCGELYRRGIWHEANGETVRCLTRHRRLVLVAGPEYPCGFHCFATKRAAESRFGDLEIMRVRIRMICATGREGRFRVLVAKEMYIPKPKEIRA